ncbi:predicted protein [Sclerotinia sclerotiorum 1980 UF-70]|uniref:Uncharacterized protein n=1 Tax=Sclerotinia sclerotiorum (strain ATCC 18683 / 1980 / Ss-1) TaxID=665079 RepID=A7EES0_SCLS1|nr:predicted protein [Sclerotinia sclerotiorum 1980 UF-70]EDO01336.1 predicted protein [Sclerotinia sclerotiorum 1980 UF-70]
MHLFGTESVLTYSYGGKVDDELFTVRKGYWIVEKQVMDILTVLETATLHPVNKVETNMININPGICNDRNYAYTSPSLSPKES